MEYIPLATNAIRMGFLAAKNLKSKIIKSPGTQGTSSIKIFDLCLSSTGLTEVAAKSRNLDIKTVIHTDNYIPEFMPKYKPATLKLTYDAKSHVLLGAQLYSEENHSQVINTLSVCIQNKMTIEDIALIDQFFLPHFNKPFNLLNATALKALEENQ
jgi:NADPH-dependent 2,4-dienoyl-CoA reductase/sulfur reductase-like enzyme